MADDAEKFRLAFIKAGIADGSRVVSTLVLINGAAAISVMAFVGSVAASRLVSTAELSPIRLGLISFVVGVATAAVMAILSYVTNSKFGEAWAKRSSNDTEGGQRADRWAFRLLYCAAVVAMVSQTCFVVGVCLVSVGLTGLSVSVPYPPAPE
jgi:hypothetical protein